MSSPVRVSQAEKSLGTGRGPVTGTGRGCERAAGVRHGGSGRATGVDSRREAVLRVLLEAYRRDAGPGALDPR